MRPIGRMNGERFPFGDKLDPFGRRFSMGNVVPRLAGIRSSVLCGKRSTDLGTKFLQALQVYPRIFLSSNLLEFVFASPELGFGLL
jgi:hypothetical protein